MVEVGVEIPDIPLRLLVIQLRPGDDAATGAVPAQRHRVGRLAQPVGIALLHLEAVRTPEDGVRFTAFKPVVAAHAVTGVTGQVLIHVVDLDDVTFLDAEQVGFRLVEHPDHGFAPVVPAVVAVEIFSGRKADVERHHADVGLVA